MPTLLRPPPVPTAMRAYAAHRDRLLVVEGVGDESIAAGDATAEEHLHDRRLECVAAHPDAPERAFVGSFDAGLFRTTDGADAFGHVGDAIEHDAVTAVTVSPHDPDVIWAGTEPSRVYRSADGGDTFERVGGVTDVPSVDEWFFPPRPDTHHVRWIEHDPNDPERVYVGIEAGALVLSKNGGERWTDRPSGSRRDNHQLATHPDAPGRVYSAAGDGYAESTDGGENWTAHMDGLEHRYVWSVLPDPGDPERVLVSAATGAGDAHSLPGESHLYRREAGRNWVRLDGALGGEGVLRAVLAGDGRPGHAYGMTNRGLYHTPDFGDSWSRVDVAWPQALREQTARGLAVVPT